MARSVLAASFTLHIAATVVWIGGLFFVVVLLPMAMRKSPPEQARLVRRSFVRRFIPWAWLSAVVFAGTGLTQLSANPQYQGLLEIHNVWSAAILVKHTVIALMVALLAWHTWILAPTFERMALGLTASTPAAVDRLWRLEQLGLTASLILGAIVIVLTAIARASG